MIYFTWAFGKDIRKKRKKRMDNDLFIKHYLLPPPQNQYTSCHEMSYSKGETKLKKEKIFLLMPCKL